MSTWLAGASRRLGRAVETAGRPADGRPPAADRRARGNSPGLNTLIRAEARRNGLGLVDLSTAFDKLDDDELIVGAWDKHPSDAGHRALFAGLRNAASQPGVIPPRPRSGAPRRGGSLVQGDRPHADMLANRRRLPVGPADRRGSSSRRSRRPSPDGRLARATRLMRPGRC